MEIKLTARIILDCLDVTFAEEEGFNSKDCGMTISPVPARVDAAFAPLGL